MNMSVEVDRFDPLSAGERDLTGVHEVVSRAGQADNPGSPPATFDAVIGRLRNPQPNLGPVHRFVARGDGRVTGLAGAYFPRAENGHLGLLELTVHPDTRRSGVGTALLRAVAVELQEHRRSVLECWNIPKGGAGESFGTALGFQVVSTTLVQTLLVADVPQAMGEVARADGYVLRRWRGTAPDELVESYADVRRAIADSPFGRSAFRFPEWTADRVRESEVDRRKREIDHRVVAVVHEDSGHVVGFTELQTYPHRQDLVYQGDTAVLAGHRGRGLGHCVKATMLRWLLSECPAVKQITTSTEASNTHMINVNLALGYRTVREMVILAQDVEELAGRLKAVP